MSWNAYMKRRSFSHFGLNFDRPLVAFNDLFHHRQTQPCPATFGRKKRSEYLIEMFLGNTAPGVGDIDLNDLPLGLCTHAKSTPRSHRLTSVFHQIDQYLADLVFVHHDLGAVQAEVLLQGDIGW